MQCPLLRVSRSPPSPPRWFWSGCAGHWCGHRHAASESAASHCRAPTASSHSGLPGEPRAGSIEATRKTVARSSAPPAALRSRYHRGRNRTPDVLLAQFAAGEADCAGWEPECSLKGIEPLPRVDPGAVLAGRMACAIAPRSAWAGSRTMPAWCCCKLAGAPAVGERPGEALSAIKVIVQTYSPIITRGTPHLCDRMGRYDHYLTGELQQTAGGPLCGPFSRRLPAAALPGTTASHHGHAAGQAWPSDPLGLIPGKSARLSSLGPEPSPPAPGRGWPGLVHRWKILLHAPPAACCRYQRKLICAQGSIA